MEKGSFSSIDMEATPGRHIFLLDYVSASHVTLANGKYLRMTHTHVECPVKTLTTFYQTQNCNKVSLNINIK